MKRSGQFTLKSFASRTLGVSLLLATLAPSAFAGQPDAKVLALIEATYNPGISASTEADGFSLTGCAINQLVIRGKDPITGQDRLVQVKHYLPADGARLDQSPSVLVLPPTGGENILDRGYANEICQQGLHALLVQSWENDTFVELDPAMHDRGALRALSAIRHVVEYLDVNRAPNIGILGTSVGAISATFAMGVEKRITAGALIVGGVGMSDIIAVSTEKGLTALRAQRMQSFGLKSVEDYRKALASKITIEPRDFVGYSGQKKVLQILASKDTTVPTFAQEDLASAFEESQAEHEVITHNDDHFKTILHSSFFFKSRIVKFLKRSLN